MSRVFVSIGFTEKEYADLKKLSGDAGITMSAVLAKLVEQEAGEKPPDEDAAAILLELRRAGSALDGLRRRAEKGGLPEAEELRAALEENRRAEEHLLRHFGI